jgi:hypothetical protein
VLAGTVAAVVLAGLFTSRRWLFLTSGCHGAHLAARADFDGIFMVSRSGRHDCDVTVEIPRWGM